MHQDVLISFELCALLRRRVRSSTKTLLFRIAETALKDVRVPLPQQCLIVCGIVAMAAAFIKSTGSLVYQAKQGGVIYTSHTVKPSALWN